MLRYKVQGENIFFSHLQSPHILYVKKPGALKHQVVLKYYFAMQ